jgi:parvulin-like peptidyl-prolyl isomerase
VRQRPMSNRGPWGAGVGVCLAVFALVSFFGCRREPVPGLDVVALVEEAEIRYGQFEDYVERNVGETEVVLSSQVLSRLFDQFLDEELLRGLAVERGLVAEGVDSRQTIDSLLATSTAVWVTHAEVVAYYEAYQEEFARPERVRLRQILVEDRAAAEQAARDLAAGQDFVAVASRLARSSPNLFGDQGELTREDLPPIFVETIFDLEPGEVSDVVPAEYGYHIFQVTERFPDEQVPLTEAAPEIRERLRRSRADDYLAGLVAEARSRYNVRVFERNLPFNYQGFYSVAPSR